MKESFLRNQTCIPVKGYNRAIIYDVLRKDYFFLPKDQSDILETDDIIDFQRIENESERKDLIDFLLEEELIFELPQIDCKDNFPPLSRDFESPNLLNTIVVHSNIDLGFFELIKNEYILNLSIIAPQINDDLLSILDCIENTEIDSVYLYIENFEPQSFVEDRKLITDFSSVFSVNFFNVNNATNIERLHDNVYFNFFKEDFSKYQSRLTEDKLNINMEHFLESYNLHSYYHGKIYIDEEGEIKNGLNNIDSFGNINKITPEIFFGTISSSKFLELGAIKKTETLVCSDCEFKYMCVDSRVPVKGKEKWYHQTECSYNPYLSTWDHEEHHVNLEDSGVAVSASGCTIDKEKLSKTFNKIWAE